MKISNIQQAVHVFVGCLRGRLRIGGILISYTDLWESKTNKSWKIDNNCANAYANCSVSNSA